MPARFLTACLTPAALLLGGILAPAAAQAPYDLHKLEKAQKAYHKAEDCRVNGDTAQAGRYYEQVKHLLPGSIYDHMAASRLRQLHVQAAAKAKLVQRVYQVADLVLPVNQSPGLNLTKPADSAGHTEAKVWITGSAVKEQERTVQDRLMKLIAATIEPGSWSEAGGPASMDYFPLGMVLVVNQTPEAHEKIAQLLSSLRHAQDTEVSVEIRLITVPEAFLKKVGINKTPEAQITSQPGPTAQDSSGTCPAAAPEFVFLNDIQVHKLMETVQQDRGTNIVAAPKVTVFNGQRSELSVQEQQYFVTGVNKTNDNNGQVVFVPQEQPFTTGLQFAVQPLVSQDRRSVRLKLQANVTDLDSSPVALIPVTSFITPIYEGGSQGYPVPFTQYIQQPKFVTLALNKTVNIPDGGTVLLSGWKKPHQVRCEIPNQEPSVLSKIPYVNRLFNNVGYGSETEHVLVMVTPRIIVNQEEEVAQTHPRAAEHSSPVVPAVYEQLEQIPCCAAAGGDACATPVSGKVAKLLKEYQHACSEGRYAAATQLAVQALAIDPACFSKTSARGKKSPHCGGPNARPNG